MKIELGKTYLNRRGQKVRIIGVAMRGNYPIAGILHWSNCEILQTFTEEGSFAGPEPSNLDLVSEYVQKPEWDWSTTLPWLNWLAIDKNGDAFLYQFEPELGECRWNVNVGVSFRIPSEYAPKFAGDWKDSLIQRPQ